jgi:hypothetical protein
MELRIVETFLGLFCVQQVQSDQGDDIKRVSEENTRLKARLAELEGVKE